MRVLWFERERNRFAPPQTWPADAAAMTSTHDLPTVAGWWRGTDIEVRSRIGLVPRRKEQAERTKERRSLWRAFRRAGAAAGDLPASTTPALVVDAAVKFIAETPSQLTLVPLEDALALEEQPNLPGRSTNTRIGAGVIRGKPGNCWRRPRCANVRPSSGEAIGDGAACDHASAIPPRLWLRRRRAFDRILCGTWHKPSLCLADYDGAAGVDAWLRCSRPDAGEPRTWRRGSVLAARARASAARDGRHRRYCAEPYGGRQRQSLVDGRARKRTRQPLRQIL